MGIFKMLQMSDAQIKKVEMEKMLYYHVSQVKESTNRNLCDKMRTYTVVRFSL